MTSPTTSGLSPSFRAVVAVGVGALLLLLAIGGLRGRRELIAAERREAELEARLVQTRESIVDLEQRIERLRTDPATLERLARDQLMMTRPDEVVIVFPRQPATTTAEDGPTVAADPVTAGQPAATPPPPSPSPGQ